LKIVVEVLATAATLRETSHAWIALAIMADAPDVVPMFVGKENVGAKVHGLSKALEPPPSMRQFG
jgi:hypothetical protein